MAQQKETYRKIMPKFWSDPKIDDDFTPADKYFYLYLMTNPHANICGCYEVSVKQMTRETGLDDKKVRALIKRMVEVHQVVDYSFDTREVLIINWHKYNWTKSADLLAGVRSVGQYIKCEKFRNYVLNLANGIDEKYRPSIDPLGTVPPQSIDPRGTSVSVSVNIISYLNKVLNTKYKDNSNKTMSLINARLNEGFTEDDFKTVIDKKVKDWGNDPKMQKFLRPETLFGTKFEGYLNEKETKTTREKVDSWV